MKKLLPLFSCCLVVGCGEEELTDADLGGNDSIGGDHGKSALAAKDSAASQPLSDSGVVGVWGINKEKTLNAIADSNPEGLTPEELEDFVSAPLALQFTKDGLCRIMGESGSYEVSSESSESKSHLIRYKMGERKGSMMLDRDQLHWSEPTLGFALWFSRIEEQDVASRLEAMDEYLKKGRTENTRFQIGAVMRALDTYKARAGRFPTEDQGLQALVTKPAEEPVPIAWQPLFRKLPTDAWNQEYVYMFRNSGDAPPEPRVISKGADGVLSTDDDIVSE